ncbi:tyrosine-type recombinase/integrase [Phytobacter diazotrophicus]|uniref:site-specific integrase n=1 Tax=Phytobacter diazotrophicus TaxID=395631 RepID=UPI002FFB778B
MMLVTKKEDEKYHVAKNKSYQFNNNEMSWTLEKNVKINVGLVLYNISDNLSEGFINTLAYFACHRSGRYVQSLLFSMKHFIEQMKPTLIDESIILNYKSSLSKKQMSTFSNVNAFLKKWHSFGYYGIDDKVIELLKNIRLKRIEAGDVVKREDPNKGPLTDIEHDNMNKAINNAYSNGSICLRDYAVTLLCSYTGRRPLQITSLKVMDLISRNKECVINFPRIKQGLGFRKVFRELHVVPQLWQVIFEQATSSIMNVEAHLGRSLNLQEKREVAIFLDLKSLNEIHNENDLKTALKNDRLHIRSTIVDTALKKIVHKERVRCLKTNENMKISARRMRYTIGTRLAQAGYDVKTIAELLDHSSIASAGIYVKNLPDSVERINKAVSTKLSILAKAFLGEAFEDESLCYSCDESNPVHQVLPCFSCPYFKKHNKNNEVIHV